MLHKVGQYKFGWYMENVVIYCESGTTPFAIFSELVCKF